MQPLTQTPESKLQALLHIVYGHTSSFSFPSSSSQRRHCQAQLGLKENQTCNWPESKARSRMESRRSTSTFSTSTRTTSRWSTVSSPRGCSTALCSRSCNAWTTSNLESSSTISSWPYNLRRRTMATRASRKKKKKQNDISSSRISCFRQFVELRHCRQSL